MKITMTVIIERQCKRFYIQKNPKKLQNVFIYKKPDTLHYGIFHENFQVGIYIQKALHFALRDVFIYKS